HPGSDTIRTERSVAAARSICSRTRPTASDWPSSSGAHTQDDTGFEVNPGSMFARVADRCRQLRPVAHHRSDGGGIEKTLNFWKHGLYGHLAICPPSTVIYRLERLYQ